ncbi:MFS transporter [Puia sp.]|uniref:MFS transporter n=1 Tax=Puia sp. TaxID=2045100 RepID=UPI002F40049F
MKMNKKMAYRTAVITYFFVNGFLYSNLTSRLPELKEHFAVSNSVLGTLLFTTAIGALVAMPLTGWLSVRYGSARIVIFMGFLFCCSVPCIAYSPDLWLGRVGFFMTGFFSGAMDITMNAQAVLVERIYKRTIMSSFHAAFSIGMALGAGAGALFADFHFPLQGNLVIAAGCCVVLLALMLPILLEHRQEGGPNPVAKAGSRRIPTAIWLIAIIGFCSMTGEGSMVDWSAIYTNTVVGMTKAFSALAIGAFATAMTIGRLFGDRLIDRLGKYPILIGSCCFSIAGLTLALSWVSAPTALLGFFLAGAGLSNVVPLIYSLAGNIPGIDPTAGIAVASTIGYSGFFVGPPVIGYLGDAFGLRIGLCFSLLLFFIMLAVSGTVFAAKRRVQST